MAEYPLHPHATTPTPGIGGVRVHVQRTANGLLTCRYVVEHGAGALQVPPRRPTRHVDGLWHATCLEAFLRTPGARGYVEINASPSTEWAAYGFDSYRAGMQVLALDPPRPVPRQRPVRSDNQGENSATIKMRKPKPARRVIAADPVRVFLSTTEGISVPGRHVTDHQVRL